MQNTRINLRVKNILQRIISENDYITISQISKDLGISTRTVLRELPSVEDWLAKKGCKLEKKSGVGIKACGSSEDRAKVMGFLSEEKEEKIYTPLERQTIIGIELLHYKEPVKIYNFTKMLKVTEGTISSDLDKVEEWLDKYNLKLVRRQGLGIYIEGDEDNIRKCMINLIYENINENYLMALMRKSIPKDPVPVSNIELIARSMLLNLVDGNTISKLENLVMNTGEYIGYTLTDSAYIGLIVHLAIAVQRISQKEDITINKQFMEELKLSSEYSIAQKLAESIENLFGISIPEDEIGYITMHIKGSKNIDVPQPGNQIIGNDELVRLANIIIGIAENETGKILSQSNKLLAGLVNHLGPALSRLRMNLEIRNPLYKEIKAYYPDLLDLAGKCSASIEKFIGMKIPQTEVAYIAMHLGAAIESSTVKKRIYRAVIACATGIGTSRLLATRIEKEYENIEIVDVVSTRHITGNWVSERGAELVISTVGIEQCPVPVIVVNPLLMEEDKLHITMLLHKLKNTLAKKGTPRKSSLSLKEKMQDLNEYGAVVTEILDNFFVMEEPAADNIDRLIEEVSNNINQDAADNEKLKKSLKSREEKGATFFKEQGLLLLHCRTGAVEKLHFGVVRAMEEIRGLNNGEDTGKVDIGLVMIVPESSSKYILEALSHISGLIIEKPHFIETMKSGTREEVITELSSVLEDFYKEKYNKYLRDY